MSSPIDFDKTGHSCFHKILLTMQDNHKTRKQHNKIHRTRKQYGYIYLCCLCLFPSICKGLPACLPLWPLSLHYPARMFHMCQFIFSPVRLVFLFTQPIFLFHVALIRPS